jgi:8-oxo-dGTP pyrophosphatase MutT (NUDIX family)
MDYDDEDVQDVDASSVRGRPARWTPFVGAAAKPPPPFVGAAAAAPAVDVPLPPSAAAAAPPRGGGGPPLPARTAVGALLYAVLDGTGSGALQALATGATSVLGARRALLEATFPRAVAWARAREALKRPPPSPLVAMTWLRAAASPAHGVSLAPRHLDALPFVEPCGVFAVPLALALQWASEHGEAPRNLAPLQAGELTAAARLGEELRAAAAALWAREYAGTALETDAALQAAAVKNGGGAPLVSWATSDALRALWDTLVAARGVAVARAAQVLLLLEGPTLAAMALGASHNDFRLTGVGGHANGSEDAPAAVAREIGEELGARLATSARWTPLPPRAPRAPSTSFLIDVRGARVGAVEGRWAKTAPPTEAELAGALAALSFAVMA